MSLNTLHCLACVRPDLNLTILTTGVAPALLIEADAREQGRSILAAHDTRLLETLGHVSWVPEADLLGSHRSKSKIICALRPCNIDDAISGTIHRKQVLLPLNVVDANAMIICHINSGDVATAG